MHQTGVHVTHDDPVAVMWICGGELLGTLWPSSSGGLEVQACVQ